MSGNIFWKQFAALFRKNWIVLLQHPIVNVLRCFVFPVAFGVFLGVADLFLLRPNNYGIGSAAPIRPLESQYDGSLALVWADATTNQSDPSPDEIMEQVFSNFSPEQRAGIRKVSTADDVVESCPQNFNQFSECWAAVVFTDLTPPANIPGSVNYTLKADGGLRYIDVEDQNSDYEKRLLPFQWAIDRAIIQLATSQTIPTPLELPFTQETNEEAADERRTGFIGAIQELLVLAFLVNFIGISYQLPGGFAMERASLLTSHMKAMGLSDAARIISWHISTSVAYIPAWVIVALTWKFRIWTETNAGIMVVIHLVLGLSLASYSIFLAIPFASRSPQLAAVASTFIIVLLAIIAVVIDSSVSNGAAFVFTIIFPPGFYVFITTALAGWERRILTPKILEGDPDNGLLVLPILIAGIIDIFLWPYLALLLERRIYDAHYTNTNKASWLSRMLPWKKAGSSPVTLPDDTPAGTAITLRNLNKTFASSAMFSRGVHVTAINDLTLNIPRGGVFVLLGSNGSGKSTLMSILAGILAPTKGEVMFSSPDGTTTRSQDLKRDGSIGIVPQKNVLFPELSCLQTLKLWKAIKTGFRKRNELDDEDLEQLLRDCDLGAKINENAGQLSGGQKRKLQLAIGLVGGSEILLVDECTSGVDPLSRRALWRTLTSVRDRTIIFTTHFLDEADLLADHIAILAAPGRLVADGSPVRLKRELGHGYSVAVGFSPGDTEKSASPSTVLGMIRQFAPETQIEATSESQYVYRLASKENQVVKKVLEQLEAEKGAHGITSYDLIGSSIEQIFLDLMRAYDNPDDAEKQRDSDDAYVLSDQTLEAREKSADDVAKLPQGKKSSPLQQALVIFYKRMLVFRRSWLSPLLAVLIAIFGCTIPLVFLENDRSQTCVRRFRQTFTIPLYIPLYDRVFGLTSSSEGLLLASPPGILDSFPGVSGNVEIEYFQNNASFVDNVEQNYRNISLGGVSFDESSGSILLVWEAAPPGHNGLAMLNLASNVLFNSALNSSESTPTVLPIIQANYEAFPRINGQSLRALRWIIFYGAALGVFPAFFSLYVSNERKVTLVQAMQFSNGLSNPVGLWLGHLGFDSIFTLISMTVITIVFGVVSNQFNGLGLLWLCLVLYGISATLFAYCVSLMVSSPLAAFATAAAYNVLIMVLYLCAYLLTLTYATTSESGRIINIIHWTMSLLTPINPLLRATFVSVNLFSLLCVGEEAISTSGLAALERYGGALLYLFIYPLIFFAILVWVDSGTTILSRLKFKAKGALAGISSNSKELADVSAEAQRAKSSSDLLRVVDVTKRFGKNTVVDHVSLGVPRDVTMALLGPNGAGKTTTFNIIRGDIFPEPGGTVLIDGVSVVQNPRKARLSLGICPQFTPIDSQLTVREHLAIYGRLKGLTGVNLKTSIDVLLRATGLNIYSERLASRLSGGNQRKVALCAAIIGNPPVILIDEFSTGVDARMRREMWRTLQTVAKGKAIIITTHSMEEASALSNKVAIIAKKLLAIGGPNDLTSRYPSYEVHFSCRTREEILETQRLMARIPGAKLADDVATRFEVPISSEGSNDTTMTLSRLFSMLSTDQGAPSEYTVEKVGLESVFLKVIKGNQVSEDRPKSRRWACW